MEMVKKSFRLHGMYCPNCAMRIEAIEDRLPGIKRVDASYQKSVMVVEYDETLVDEAGIVAEVGRLGYTAEVA
jgi:copper chaperone CopZ